MEQIRLFFPIQKEKAEVYFEKLTSAFEEAPFPIAFNDIDEEDKFCELSLYISKDQQEAVTKILSSLINLEIADIKIEELPNIDWVKHSLASLKPVQVGCFFIHGQHDRDKKTPGNISIEIDAAQAFGTGHHGTTTACLEFLEKLVPQTKPKTILDLGTGSAILAIAAAKLHKCSIIASDNDPVALKVASHNAALNGVQNLINFILAEGFSHKDIAQFAPYELIIANILANPLMNLAPEMAKHTQKDSIIILSGILKEQGKKLLDTYEMHGFSMQESIIREGWVSFYLKKN